MGDAVDRDDLPIKFILRSGRAKASAPVKRRKLSAKARKAIGDAQYKRWAALKGRQEVGSP